MERPTIRIQAVLYNEDRRAILKCVESIAASLTCAKDEPLRISIALGDASPQPLFSADDIEKLAQTAGSAIPVSYSFFNENTGYGKGHNLLSQQSDDDYLLIINPDIVFDPRCICRLVATAASDPSIGIVEARQTPLENARWFDPVTGDTDWACGACMLVRRSPFIEVGGFDSDTFFMYCEDVDLSWAFRRQGYRIVLQPAAIACHPHRLSPAGSWEPNATERFHDALGKLLLSCKWGDAGLTRRLAASLSWDGCLEHRNAVRAFRAMKRNGQLPQPVEGGSRGATFHRLDHTTYRLVESGNREDSC